MHEPEMIEKEKSTLAYSAGSMEVKKLTHTKIQMSQQILRESQKIV